MTYTAQSLEAARGLQRMRKFDEAAQICREILSFDATHFDALSLLGVLQLQAGRAEEAEKIFAKAEGQQPLSPELLRNRGLALLQLGRHAEALNFFERAIARRPGFAEALIARGDALRALGRPAEAVSSFDQALALRPDYAHVWYNRGAALAALNRDAEALESFRKAAAHRALASDALYACGVSLVKLGQYHDALKLFDQVLRAQPGRTDALFTRGQLLTGLKRYSEAAVNFALALGLAPEHPYLEGELLQCRLYCCDWRSLREQREQISADLNAGKRAATPMAHTMWSVSEREQLLCAQIWIAHDYPPSPDPLWCGEHYRHDRIRIAYLAPELQGNAVATQIAGVFEHHDRSRFETVMLAFGRDYGSPMRQRVANAFEHFIDIRTEGDLQAAKILREMEIDIAIDIAGITGNSRTRVLALRPSPVQVNYLGFPATMGAAYMDYIIADKTVIPEHRQGHYAEKVVYLPHSYMPHDVTRRIGRLLTRREVGLPERGFVFCSFNNSFKIMPEVFDIWIRLLLRIEGSVLWLPEYNPAAIANLTREAATRGLGAGRLLFAKYEPADERHLARLQFADLFLDTLPYNAHSTACDALWAGLPVVSCLGEGFAGRVASGILRAIGLPELVADSLEAYEALALKLAGQPALLASIRSKLVANRSTESLFDTARFTRDLERAYTAMWQHCQRGEAPASFALNG